MCESPPESDEETTMFASPLAAPAAPLPARPDQVRIAEASFWGARRATNRRVTIASQLRQLRETGRLAALDPAHVGERHPFWDSDIAKWLEAACEELSGGGDDPALRAGAREVMEAFARGQDA